MKRLGILALVLAFAFGALGVGYAHWSQTLYIEGTAETGELCVGFTKAFSNDDGKVDDPLFDPDDDGTDPGYDKDVGSCSASLEGPTCDSDCYGKAVLTVNNAYPCYGNVFLLEITNCGTIPVKGTINPGIEIDNPNPDIVKVEVVHGNPVPQPEIPQIDPGESLYLYCFAHLEQCEDCQGETYTFTVTINLTQWNILP